LGASRFWAPLWRTYPRAPSLVLCRVPELEYASAAELPEPALDHCCGDGRFAALAWPGRRLAAGCDMDASALARAGRSGQYERLDRCDAARRLPFAGAVFRSVFSNSALEHIADLDAALAEVARVLAPDGLFAFSVLNHRYFEWWPLSEDAKRRYRDWQPFCHALDLGEWERRLARAGLRLVSVAGYLDREAARVLAELDYEFSGLLLRRRFSLHVFLSHCAAFLARPGWRRALAPLVWRTGPDAGAGYFVKAVRHGT
jgi:SAM-dependent methyltransferase